MGIKAGPPVAAILIFVVLFFGQGLLFNRANSPTYDEAMHLASGYSYLATRDFRVQPENPPLINQLSALPLFLLYRMPFTPDAEQWNRAEGFAIGQMLMYRSPISADRILFLSRLPNLLIGGLLVALIGWWSYRLWGRAGSHLSA